MKICLNAKMNICIVHFVGNEVQKIEEDGKEMVVYRADL
jgi:hypothetical protein